MIKFASKVISSVAYVVSYIAMIFVLGVVALFYGVISGVAHIWSATE